MNYILKDPKSEINVYRKAYNMDKVIVAKIVGAANTDKWTRTLVDLMTTSDSPNFEIYLEAMLGSSIGVIAIDDFYLYDKPCKNVTAADDDKNKKFQCKDGNVITADKVCNFIQDCADGDDEKVCADCTFENSTCQYKDQSSGELAWYRTQAQASENGPSIDHTTRTSQGYYMYVQTSKSVSYSYASLRLQQELKPCSATCELEFYYHMFGSSDDLLVYLIGKQYLTPSKLLELSGDFGDSWNKARIQLGRISESFVLDFDASRFFDSSDYDLAIDDIRLINCEFSAPRPSCPSNYFTCERKSCVPISRKCDLIDDCGDGSDEKNCTGYTTCDFENGFCSWKNDPDSVAALSWDLNSGKFKFYVMKQYQTLFLVLIFSRRHTISDILI